MHTFLEFLISHPKMVCVPCIIIPVLLIIWRFLIQPMLLNWWQFRSKQQEIKTDEQPPELIKECTNGICKLSWKKN